MLSSLLAGIVFGLTAGAAPGPLMTLAVTQTLRYGTKQGILVALAPLITDLPIIVGSLVVLSRLNDYESWLGAIALFGSAYIFYLGWESIRITESAIDMSQDTPRSIWKGAIVNALNPHPYLFWTTVGGPFVVRSQADGPWAPWLFIGSFYLLLVGVKIVIVLVASRFRHLLAGPAYRWIVRILGVALWGFALFLLRDALNLLGIITVVNATSV